MGHNFISKHSFKFLSTTGDHLLLAVKRKFTFATGTTTYLILKVYSLQKNDVMSSWAELAPVRKEKSSWI